DGASRVVPFGKHRFCALGCVPVHGRNGSARYYWCLPVPMSERVPPPIDGPVPSGSSGCLTSAPESPMTTGTAGCCPAVPVMWRCGRGWSDAEQFLDPCQAEVDHEDGRQNPHQPADLTELARRALDDGVGDDARSDAGGDVEGERHEGDRQERGNRHGDV